MDIKKMDDYIAVKLANSDEILQKLKLVGSGHWDPGLGIWKFPLEKEASLIKLSRNYKSKNISNTSTLNHDTKSFGRGKDVKAINHIKDKDQSIESQAEELLDHEYIFNKLSNFESVACGNYSDFILDRTLELNHYLLERAYKKEVIEDYLIHLESFLEFSKGRDDINSINKYLFYLLDFKNSSHSYANQAINTIKLSLKIQGKLESEIITRVKPKNHSSIPNLLSQEEVMRIIESTSNSKHKTMLMLAYSCALRLDEVVSISLNDLDLTSASILIRDSKTKKERISKLSERMLSQIKSYRQDYKPSLWLFENKEKCGHISQASVQKIFNDSKKKAKLKTYATFQSLRHSYASHLLESGVDICHIHELLGSSRSRTSQVYTSFQPIP